MRTLALFFGLAVLFLAASVSADEAAVDVHKIGSAGVERKIGVITLEDTDDGLLIKPDLSELTPGVHGFHAHENPDCGQVSPKGERGPGLGAGPHYDPEQTGRHLGPYAAGHSGDLPALTVDASGKANLAVLAPRLNVNQLRGRALVVHEGGDTYSDQPELGGGKGRIACGVVPGK